MYLKSISLTNFRQFGMKDGGEPGLTVFFNPNFNVLVGENDAGKTAITDAIRYLLGSVSDDYEKINKEEFYCSGKDKYSESFYIEGVFTDLSEREAGAFLEWLSFAENDRYQLRVSLKVERKKNDNGKEFIDRKVLAGDKVFESRLDNAAKNLLKATYLKPLRDANNELKPGFRSRLAHILKAHPAFKNEDDDSVHKLVEAMEGANQKIEDFFKEEYKEGHSLVSDIEELLNNFYDFADQSKSKSRFTVSKTDLLSILRKLNLETEDVNLGLGNLNLLFIATELLLLEDYTAGNIKIGPNITLIEEIEAHLHTQAQIRLIKHLEGKLENPAIHNQFILTSHSTNLVASIDPQYVILLHNKVAYPLSEAYTKLTNDDYSFLERFLDSTKSNLFFAKGLIFVEGDAEMQLLPALANLIGYPLHKYGVSLVNVQGTSFERYIKLFSRSELWLKDMGLPSIGMPISIITDLDIKPWIYYKYEDKQKSIYKIESKVELELILKLCDENIDSVIIEQIGNEYSTLKKLAKDFGFTITKKNEKQITEIVQKNITKEYITAISTEKEEQIRIKYADYDANLKVYIAPEWTLEYSLALSKFKNILFKIVHEVRYKRPYEGKQKQVFDKFREKLVDCSEETSYEIFKPINDKLVSKAEVAQKLAIYINKVAKYNDNDIRKTKMLTVVKSDPKIKYLLDAIEHASNIEHVSKKGKELSGVNS